MLNGKFISRLREAADDEILTTAADCWPYGYDNSRLHAVPDAVVFARDHEQVAATVRECRDHRVPVTARGRGTATTGAAVPVRGGVVVSFERMSNVVEIDAENRTLRSEPGATNRVIQDYCKPYGFFWPPDPSSADYSTLGGNLACNAAGPGAVKYGTARENTLGLKAVTGDGRTIVTGAQTTKGVVGLDLTRLLIGSEGTLALITEATLKLTPLPPCRKTMRACYRSTEAAAAAVATVMAQPATPCALELMDDVSVRLVRERADVDLDPRTRALLIIEADGEPDALAEAVGSLERAAHNDGLLSFITAADEPDVRKLWKARKALSPALRTVAAGKINEDVVVPVSQLANFIEKVNQISKRRRITVASFGHAGNGNLHVNVLYEPNDPTQQQAAERCVEEVFDLTLALGGTLSGEHGVGLTKRDYVAREISRNTLEVTRAVMRAFDPCNILNPGKNVPGTEE